MNALKTLKYPSESRIVNQFTYLIFDQIFASFSNSFTFFIAFSFSLFFALISLNHFFFWHRSLLLTIFVLTLYILLFLLSIYTLYF